MITADLFKKEEQIVTIGDYSLKCPKGKRNYFSFVTYEDYSDLHISQIFADNRYDAWKQVLAIATEILDEVYTISIQECVD